MKRPFCVREHAFLATRRASSTSKKGIYSIARYVIFLFRGFFFHYNVMIFYYSINSPLSQFSPNLQQNRSVFSVCRRPFEASPPAPLRMERGVITEIPLYVIHAFSVSSPFLSRPIGVTSHTTPLSIRRGVGGEACPIGVTSHTTSLPAGGGVEGGASCGKGERQPPSTRFSGSIKKFILTSYVEKSAPIGNLLVHR